MMGRWISWLRGQPGNKQVILYSGGGMLAFLLWASLAPVDEVTRGQGRVIPSSKAQRGATASITRICGNSRGTGTAFRGQFPVSSGCVERAQPVGG